MPTVAEAGGPSPVPRIHQHRQVAESFGSDAERYDRARPRYPDALVRRIVATSPGPEILDVGCGTGIVARQLREAGATVLGVEPDARMAGVARRDGLTVDVATFEAWEPAGRQFDAVVSGTAWHWVDPTAGMAQAAGILRPGGRLAVFWLVSEPPAEVANALAAAYRRVVPDAPFTLPPATSSTVDSYAYQPLFTQTADGIRATGAFGEPEQWRFDEQRSYTRDEWLDQLPTSGALTRLPPDQLAEVLAGVGATLDALGGHLTVPTVTVAVTAVRPST